MGVGGPPAGSWSTQSGTDLGFTVWKRGGLTSFSINSTDPSMMMRQVQDYGKSKGSQIYYDDISIVDTGTVVSGQFNSNTLVEAEQAILKYAPADWYTYYDPADLTFNLRPRPEIVKHWFELGKNIESLSIEEDIESLVNEVFFSGGEVSPSVNLFKRYVDTDSQAEWRRGLEKLSDQRVTDPTTAQIISQSAINRNKDPIYVGELSIFRKFYEEIVQPGDLIGFRGFGNFIDFLRLQAVYVETSSDRIKIQLGVMLPPVSKRVEDIRRNLDLLEMQNNPTNTT